MSAAARTAQPSAELIAFAGNGWAFREAARAPGRAIVLSAVASALKHAQAPQVEIAAALVPPPARLRAHALGRPAPTTPLHAALLTGLAVGDAANVATPAICAALALGESLDAGGATVLDAIIAGAEVAARIARALGPGHLARGWDTRGTAGRLGAAIAATRVLGLQRDAVRDALGIAATAAGGLTAASGTMTAAYVTASAAADGVEAALLARAEFTGAPLALEGRRGLAALMSDALDTDSLVAGLGETFAFEILVHEAPAGVNANVQAMIGRLERLASIRELIDAA